MTDLPETPLRPTISVLVATFARPDQLRRALRSLHGQVRPADEVIVVFWEGDEQTRALLDAMHGDEAWSMGHPELRFHTTAENTVIAKENAGIELATGDMVCFMDDDAAARPDWLERICGWYSDPSVGAVGGRDVVRNAGRVVDDPAREVGLVRWTGRIIANHHRRIIGARDVDFLKGVNMSFRKSLLPPIDGRLAGAVPYGFEIDLGLSIKRLGYRVVYDPAIVVDHYSTSDYAASGPIAWKVNHNQTYVLLKHLPSLRKFTFLAYTFLLGDRNTIGLLRVPFLIVRDRWPLVAIAAHFRGKLAGVQTYARSRRVPSGRGGA